MRKTLRVVARLAVVGTLVAGGFWLLRAPDSPLPPELNPTLPLDLGHPESPLIGFKLRRALVSGESCRAALETGAAFEAMEPLVADDGCGIETRVSLSGVGGTSLPAVQTACETALRLAVWERFTVRAAAGALGADVVGLSHQGSYNCRAIRGGTRPSTHATARAIDIRGVTLADGRDITLLGNWKGDGAVAAFWRALRDGGCDWFTATLGPDFNAAHADHLHLQSGGWRTCR
ncbi:MAG: extensin family protein [Jannaschia sp.]